MRIGHASISENGNNGRDGRAKAGDQTGKEVCIRPYYSKPWKYLLRCTSRTKADIMAKACESICNNQNVGYDQSQRLTLHNELAKINFVYDKLNTPCECDCSSLMTVCAECAGIFPSYTNGNAPVTANMVNKFQATNQFDLFTDASYINCEDNLLRGDILVGPPNTHTVMVLDNGTRTAIAKRRTLKKGMSGSDVLYMQNKLKKAGYDISVDGQFGPKTQAVLTMFQEDHKLLIDGICGPETWRNLELVL